MAFFEIEQKYRVRDPKSVRRKLKALGIRKVRSGREESEFFDCQGILKKKKMALRLRRFQTGEAHLTLKGPALRHRYSKRFELELPVSYRQTRATLRALGFRAVKKYVKQLKEDFRAGASKISLDHLSKLGWFLEIEGAPEQISRLERRLGFKASDREKRSYFQLLFR